MGEWGGAAVSRRSFLAGSATVMAAAGLALSGCTSSSAPSGAAASGQISADIIIAAAAGASGSVSPVGLNGGSPLMLAATWHVFEGLYDLDMRTYEPYSALADGDPVAVSDTEYLVALRKGAKFSDGSAVAADDVAHAFELNLADGIVGPMLDCIKSVAAKNESTVSIKLNYPCESLLRQRLALVKVFPASLTEDDLARMPIGSGPWMYESIDGSDGGQLVFAANPNYNGPRPASRPRMVWEVLPDDEARCDALSSGEVHVMEAVPDAKADELEGAGAVVDYVQGFSQAFLMFNCQKAPFNDRRVRQAFFYAVDAERLVSSQMRGHAATVKGFLPESFEHYSQASTVYAHDPEKARALLEKAGAKNLSVELLVNTTWVKDLAPQIQRDLAEVGIEVAIKEEQIDWSAYNAEVEGELPYDVILTQGDPSCFGADPDLLMSLWYGDTVWTRGRTRWAEAGDGKFEELQTLLQQARESSGNAQQAAWGECFDFVSEQVPLYALFHRKLATAHRSAKVDDFEPIGTAGLYFLS